MHADVYKRPLFWVLAIFLIALSLFYRPAPSQRDIFHAISKKTVSISGRVESFAISGKNSQNIVLTVSSMNGKPASGKVYARLKDFSPQWKDKITVEGMLKVPYGIDLPGNFNWKKYLSFKHIFTEIKGEKSFLIQPAWAPYRLIRYVRESILSSFQRSFPAELAGIAGGILLGEKGDISSELYTSFQDSGAIHLLVASGGNVGFVMLLMIGAASVCGLNRKKIIFLSLGVAGLYTLIAGADAPLVRAYFMAVCACGGYLLGRNSGILQGLFVSCLVLLICRPASVFETGFQMSFLATYAIVVCLSNYRIPAKWPKIVRFFSQIFLATLASQLALLPIFTNVFYKVSITGLFSNMLLVPLASVIMGLGFLYYVFDMLHVGFLLYGPTFFCLDIFKYLVEFFASFRLAAMPVTAWGYGFVGAYYVFLFWVLHWPLKPFSRKALPYCVGFACLFLFLQIMLRPTMTVYLLNEWNRTVALVQTRTGETLLFGEGISSDKIEKVFLSLGTSTADAWFVFKNGGSQKGKEYASYKKEIPWADLWPGEEIPIGESRVQAVWGLHRAKTGTFWENRGFSGTEKDSISYCIENSGKRICLGALARFIVEGETLYPSRRNETVKIKI